MKILSNKEYAELVHSDEEFREIENLNTILRNEHNSMNTDCRKAWEKIRNNKLAISMREDQIDRLVDQLIETKAYANSRDDVVVKAKREANAYKHYWEQEKNYRLSQQDRIDYLEEQLDKKEEALEIIRNYVETV